jgi:hypothetical protein
MRQVPQKEEIMVSSWETEQTKPTEYRPMTQKRVNKGTKEIQAMLAETSIFCVRLCAV